MATLPQSYQFRRPRMVHPRRGRPRPRWQNRRVTNLAPGRAPVAQAMLHAHDAGYDLLLLAHVLAALIALGSVVAAGVFALSLRRSAGAGGPVGEALVRYYRPGVNWAGRALYLVPVLGLALMALSEGDWTFTDAWILGGLASWAAVAVLAEAVLWPEERRLQGIVSRRSAEPVALSAVEDEEGDPAAICVRVVVVSVVLALALVATAVVMVAKP